MTCKDQNNYPITNKDECDIASNLLALELPHFISTHSEHETKRNCPKGCYFHVTNRQVYWNNHYAGSNVNSSLRICRAPVPCNTDSDCTDAQYCYHSNKYCKDKNETAPMISSTTSTPTSVDIGEATTTPTLPRPTLR